MCSCQLVVLLSLRSSNRTFRKACVTSGTRTLLNIWPHQVTHMVKTQHHVLNDKSASSALCMQHQLSSAVSSGVAKLDDEAGGEALSRMHSLLLTLHSLLFSFHRASESTHYQCKL